MGGNERKSRYFSYSFSPLFFCKRLTAHREACTTKLNMQPQKENKLLGIPI